MDERIKLYVMAISGNQIRNGAYALILAEEFGNKKIPIVIGEAEAQSIAICIEGICLPRPLTHDLFVSFAHSFGVKLKEVFIYKYEDAIFSSELTFSDGERTIKIDARTSDAIALALRTNTPIYTTREIIDKTGMYFEDSALVSSSSVEHSHQGHSEDIDSDDTDDSDEILFQIDMSYHAEPRVENYSIEELERTLAKLVERENYEEAEHIMEILRIKMEALDDFSDDFDTDQSSDSDFQP